MSIKLKKIIFLGPPGSGKGTQANLIAKKYSIPNISAGEILRKLFTDADKKSNCTFDIFNKTINTINSGNLVDDELIIRLIINRIYQNDCEFGFVLDGFPRNINQAMSFKEYNISIDFVVEFVIPDSLIIDRIVGRQVHINSGRTYHIKYNPPKYPGLDDVTGEQLITRKDDNEEIIQQRLFQYHQYTAVLKNYYKIESKKGNCFYFVIDGNQKIIEIYKELINRFTIHSCNDRLLL